MAVSISISISQNSQSIANNTSNVTVTVKASWTGGSYNLLEKSGYLVIDGTKYTFTSPFNTGRTTSGTGTLYTKTVTITHNSNGEKTLSCSASYTTGVSSGTVTASASKTLTTIPRKSTLSVANGTLGTEQTLTVTQKATSFTHTITYKCGTASGTICTKSSSTSIKWTPPVSLASQNTTGKTVSITLTITTYSGSTNVGNNSYTKSYSIPSSVKPSCTIAVSDPTGYADTYGGYLKGLSKFKVVVTPTLAYTSPIAFYSTTANGSKYTAASFTTGVVKSSGTQKITAKVTDTRGYSSDTAETSVAVLDYNAPIISKLSVGRCNGDGAANDQGDHTKITFSASVTSLNGKNTASYELFYRKTTETVATSIKFSDYGNVYSVTDIETIVPTETGSSYVITLYVKDNFYNNTPISKTTSVSTGFTLMHWLASGLGMAIGKIAELTNVLDIGFQTRFNGGILHPVLPPNADLNDVRTPNTYVGANLSSNSYVNCPLISGTFTLEVVGMGDEGQVKQRITSCRKTDARALERIYYSSGWGEWVCVSDYAGTLLWSGGYYMTAGHTATLSEPVSKQKNGIVLVFSEYIDGETSNTSFHCRFVPKMLVAKQAGKGHCFQFATSSLTYFATKYLFIHDDRIVGHENGDLNKTGTCGITCTNNRFVLRYVIGV